MSHGGHYVGPEPLKEACSGLWRSETMNLVSIHIQREAAHDTILALGKLGVAQFRDLNQNHSSFSRQFTTDVRTCEDAERRIRFFEDQLRRNNAGGFNLVPEVPVGGRDEEEMVETLDGLVQRLEQLEVDLKEANGSYETLLTQKFSAMEYLEVLRQDRSFFRGDSVSGEAGLMSDVSTGGDTGVGSRVGGLRYIAGVMDEPKHVLFERLLYRATRGNMFFRTAPTSTKEWEDPATGQPIEKLVFVVFFGAKRAEDKIRKICESQQISIYPYNIDEDQNEAINETQGKLHDVNKTIEKTDGQRKKLLTQIKEHIYGWKKIVVTEKSIYAILNCLTFEGQMVRAEAWVPAADMDQVREALREAKRQSAGQIDSFLELIESPKDIKPTYFRTNKVVANFQAIVDSYGMARYKEVNPGVLTIVTFPFLFGIMFGDVGHAFIMFLFASFLILFEKRLLKTKLNEIIEMVFKGRYVVLFMSIFAFWTGLLYNDMFGIMIAPFGGNSFWAFPENAQEAAELCDPEWGAVGTEEIACRIKGASVYPFGIDPSWSESNTKLAFMNSLKMKMAVILGVGQMFIGEILQLLNHIRTGDKKQIWFRWLPEVVFLIFTFGYMDLMIVIKWLTNWGAEMAANHGPPLLLGTMTDFFLSMGAVVDNQYLFWGTGAQGGLQTLLLVCAVIAVPLLLFPIPYLEYQEHKKTTAYDHTIGEEAGEEHVDTWDFSEIVIHQIIHTIEYVLGCVSNTASYLRLWALSLAHAELSEVFWSFAWMLGLNMDSGNGVIVFFMWSVWFAVTIGVLLLMESLSAFLHALRLHWVEFNNKYYYGDGYKFAPYDLDDLVPKGFVYVASFKEDI